MPEASSSSSDIGQVVCKHAWDQAVAAQQSGDPLDAARRVLAALPIVKRGVSAQLDMWHHSWLTTAMAELAYMLVSCKSPRCSANLHSRHTTVQNWPQPEYQTVCTTGLLLKLVMFVVHQGNAPVQALELCQVGNMAAQRLSDALLWELGCRFRLAAAAFDASPLQHAPCERTPATPYVVDNLLPGAADTIHSKDQCLLVKHISVVSCLIQNTQR